MKATIEFFNKLEQEIRSGCTDQHPAEDVATETAQPQENHNIIENMQEEKKEPEDKETQERERLIRKITFEELYESDDNAWSYLTDDFKLEWIEKIVRRFPEKTQQQKLINQFYWSYNQKHNTDINGNIYEPYDPFSEWSVFSGKVSFGCYLQDPLPELEEHTDEAMMNLLRKYKSDIAQLREALNNALEEDEKDRAIEEKVEEIKSLQAENERLRAEIAQMSAEGTQPVEIDSIDKYFTLDRMAEVIKSDFNDFNSALRTINIMRKMVDSKKDKTAAQAVLDKMDEVENYLKGKETNRYGDYVNGDKIVNNHDGKESK